MGEVCKLLLVIRHACMGSGMVHCPANRAGNLAHKCGGVEQSLFRPVTSHESLGTWTITIVKS